MPFNLLVSGQSFSLNREVFNPWTLTILDQKIVNEISIKLHEIAYETRLPKLFAVEKTEKKVKFTPNYCRVNLLLQNFTSKIKSIVQVIIGQEILSPRRSQLLRKQLEDFTEITPSIGASMAMILLLA